MSISLSHGLVELVRLPVHDKQITGHGLMGDPRWQRRTTQNLPAKCFTVVLVIHDGLVEP